MRVEDLSQRGVALWDELPVYERARALSRRGEQPSWLPMRFPVLGQEATFGLSPAADMQLPPSCCVMMIGARARGRLHVDGRWLTSLCEDVGLGGVVPVDWAHITGDFPLCLLQWLLSGLLNSLLPILGDDAQFCEDVFDTDAEYPVRIALTPLSESAPEHACIWLDFPESATENFPRMSTDDLNDIWKRVPLTASVQAGYQTLRLDQLESLTHGDIVLLKKPLESLLLVLPTGQQADIRVEGNNYVAATGWYQDDKREVAVNTINTPADGDGDPMLDQLTVQLVCEVGRVSMTMSELKSLQPGTMLPMDRRVQQAVDLMINGLKIGQGELIRLDDTLGVKVTRLAKSNG